MSSAKAALESDTRVRFSSMHFVHVIYPGFHSFQACVDMNFGIIQVLAFEAGRRKGIRVNAISAGTVYPISYGLN